MRKAACLLMLLATAGAVRGDIVNGGDEEPVGNDFHFFTSDVGQTFTAVDSQIRVASIGITASSTTTGFSVTVAIYEGTGLDEFPVASQSRSDIPNGRFGWVDFEFDNPADLVVGHTYTLWISTDQPVFCLFRVNGDPYADGQQLMTGNNDWDLWFRILTAPLPGACCINGACLDGIEEATCSIAGGTYQGDGRSCDDNLGICIPRPCCTDVGCEFLTEPACTSRDDWQDWYRADTCSRCIPPLGACCFTGVCIPSQTEETCLDALASWAGPLTDCKACPPCEGPDFDGDGAEDNCDTDIDNDGIRNDDDVCDFTPLGLAVQPNGTVPADLVGDCTVDLRDYALWQLQITGP